jgi:hypothetical protein
MTDIRISSTPIGDFVGCPRRWAYSHLVGYETRKNENMAIGTLMHAALEFYYAGNMRFPDEAELRQMEGNYDPPSLSIDLFGRSAFVLATTMAERAVALCADLGVIGRPEVAIADMPGLPVVPGFSFHGVIDLLDDSDPRNPVIHDWKSRGSFRYAPHTVDEFATNPQLNYYAAILAMRDPQIESVTIRHCNVLRVHTVPPACPAGAELVSARLERWYLESSWLYMTTRIFPEMLAIKAALEGGHFLASVERQVEACFDYGGCTHMSYCQSGGTKLNEGTVRDRWRAMAAKRTAKHNATEQP